MSESNDKLITASKQQPSKRRRSRPVAKTGKRPVKNQHGGNRGENVALTKLNHQISSHSPTGGQKPPAKIVMPAVVKPIPRSKHKIPQPSKGKLKTVRVEKQGNFTPKRQASRKTRLKPMARLILYTLRLLIVGVGLGAIVGTLLSILDPATRMTITSASQSQANLSQSNPSNSINPRGLYLSQEIFPLKTAVQNLAAANPNLIPGVFIVDLDTGGYIDINGNARFPAASTIKVPILIAFFQDVDAGKIRLDEMLTIKQEMIAGGSGNLRTQAIGSQYTALDIATKMIVISDNTATNMLIARMGGKDLLNQRFRSWGLATTMIRNPLPDLEGTNTTSAKELGDLIAKVNQGNLVSLRSRDSMLDIMSRTQRNNLLPSGLGNNAKAYHKTGDIGKMLADAGLIDVPTGKRYIAAVMVQRPHNHPAAEKLISSISKVAYQYFSQAVVQPRTLINNTPINNFQQPVQPFTKPFVQPQVMNRTTPNQMVHNIPMSSYQSPGIPSQYYPPQ